jgi:stage II sporulation protein D
VRTFALEDYVARVLAGEAAARSPAAALEALAITARTFAVANRGRHQRDGFDLCPLTHCQVLREPDAAGRAAVAATAGQVLTWEDAPAQVFYTASCGGTSERPSDVWAGSQDPPYLRIHHDSACKREPHWASEIPGPDLDRVLRAAGFRGAACATSGGSRTRRRAACAISISSAWPPTPSARRTSALSWAVRSAGS